jgi:hypothetical protein
MASRNAAVLQKRERCTSRPTTEPNKKAAIHSPGARQDAADGQIAAEVHFRGEAEEGADVAHEGEADADAHQQAADGDHHPLRQVARYAPVEFLAHDGAEQRAAEHPQADVDLPVARVGFEGDLPERDARQFVAHEQLGDQPGHHGLAAAHGPRPHGEEHEDVQQRDHGQRHHRVQGVLEKSHPLLRFRCFAFPEQRARTVPCGNGVRYCSLRH